MIRILLVEDNDLVREMMLDRFEDYDDYNLVTASDGQEAINQVKSQLPDIVLMDLSIPIIDGWEATRQLKADPSTSHIPIIALTAHAVVGEREKSLQAGCDEYESKPVDFPRLLTKIEALAKKG